MLMFISWSHSSQVQQIGAEPAGTTAGDSRGANWQGSRQLQQQLWKFGTCPEHNILLVDRVQPNKAQLPQQWQRADQRLQLAPRHQQVAWPPAGACVCGGIHV